MDSFVDWADFQAICAAKARYCRCLDTKDWVGYADQFTEDAVLDTSGAGGPVVKGRTALAAFVESSMGAGVTVHQVHAPEITMTGPDSAHAIFAMQDRVVFAEERVASIGMHGLTGYGHYSEDYCRSADGQWRIARSALTRLHVDYERVATCDQTPPR